MAPVLYLHIGAPKAGSSTIQRFLRANEAGLAARLDGLKGRLEAEIEAAAPRAVFLSHESLFDRVGEPEEMERLRALLAPMFERIAVLAYLRRQDAAAVSRHAMALRNGAAEGFSATPDIAAMRTPWYDYLPILRMWKTAFAPDRLQVRRFGPAYFEGGELVADLGAALGLEVAGLEPIEPQNRAGDVRRLEFLHLLEARIGENDDPI